MYSSVAQWIRLTAAAATIIGAGVVSSVASAEAEAPPSTGPPATEVEGPVTLDEPVTIEMVLIEMAVEPPLEPVPEVPEPSLETTVPQETTTLDETADAPETTVPVVDALAVDPALTPANQKAEPQQALVEHEPDVEAPATNSHEETETHDGGHDKATDEEAGQHEGTGGTGNPYRMTFDAVWFTADGSPILELAPESSSWFNLAAASQTGSGKPTTATCSYPEGSNVLVCEYENSGHTSVVDGMVVPGRQTATYTVAVVADPEAWSIANANDGPYSARDLCPRGNGSDSGGDHGSDSGGDHGSDSGGDHGSDSGDDHGSDRCHGSDSGSKVQYCEHTVEIRQTAITIPPVEPPIVEPPATEPPPVEPPAVEPPPVEPPAAVLSAAATLSLPPQALPASGASVSVMLTIGLLMTAAGVGILALTRRRDDPLALGISEAQGDTEAGLQG